MTYMGEGRAAMMSRTSAGPMGKEKMIWVPMMVRLRLKRGVALSISVMAELAEVAAVAAVLLLLLLLLLLPLLLLLLLLLPPPLLLLLLLIIALNDLLFVQPSMMAGRKGEGGL